MRVSSKAGAISDYFYKPAKFNEVDADVNVNMKCRWIQVSKIS